MRPQLDPSTPAGASPRSAPASAQDARRLPATVAIVGIALVAALGFWLAPGSEAEAPPGTEKQSAAAPGGAPKRRVEVVRPRREAVTRRIVLPGDIEGLERVDLHARASGFVESVRVDVGDLVKGPRDGRPGDLLLKVAVPEMLDELDRAKARVAEAEAAALEADAKAARAKAELELAELTATRYENLRKDGAVTVQDLDQALAKLALARAAINETEAAGTSARARIATAKAQEKELRTLIAYAEVRAPFDGIVTDRRIDAGGFVPPASSSMNRPLLSVVRVDVLRIWIDVSEPDVPFVEVGKPAVIEVEALSGRKFPTRVTRFAGALDPATRTMRTAIDVENKDLALRPGTYARVTLDLETREGALTVPAESLGVRKHDAFVFCVENGRAKRLKVVTGIDDGRRVEIREGLKGDEVIATSGKSALTDGAEVEPVLVEPARGPG